MGATHDRIIVATNELFRRHGYNGTTLSQISEASAATIGSIYHFFPGGKEALGVAVVETTGAVYRELFESIVADADDPAAAYVDFFTGAAAASRRAASSIRAPSVPSLERSPTRVNHCGRPPSEPSTPGSLPARPSHRRGNPERRRRRTGDRLRLDRRGHVRAEQDNANHHPPQSSRPPPLRTCRARNHRRHSRARVAREPGNEGRWHGCAIHGCLGQRPG